MLATTLVKDTKIYVSNFFKSNLLKYLVDHNDVLMLGNYLQQTTSADNIFQMYFFLAL